MGMEQVFCHLVSAEAVAAAPGAGSGFMDRHLPGEPGTSRDRSALHGLELLPWQRYLRTEFKHIKGRSIALLTTHQ